MHLPQYMPWYTFRQTPACCGKNRIQSYLAAVQRIRCVLGHPNVLSSITNDEHRRVSSASSDAHRVTGALNASISGSASSSAEASSWSATISFQRRACPYSPQCTPECVVCSICSPRRHAVQPILALHHYDGGIGIHVEGVVTPWTPLIVPHALQGLEPAWRRAHERFAPSPTTSASLRKTTSGVAHIPCRWWSVQELPKVP